MLDIMQTIRYSALHLSSLRTSLPCRAGLLLQLANDLALYSALSDNRRSKLSKTSANAFSKTSGHHGFPLKSVFNLLQGSPFCLWHENKANNGCK